MAAWLSDSSYLTTSGVPVPSRSPTDADSNRLIAPDRSVAFEDAPNACRAGLLKRSHDLAAWAELLQRAAGRRGDDHRLSGDLGDRGVLSGADQRQRALDDSRHRDRPARHQLAACAVDRVQAPAGARRRGGHPGKADVAAVGDRAVDLVAGHDHVVVAGVGQVADRRLVDRLGDHLCAGGDLGRVDQRHRIAGHRFAVGLPRVQMPVEAWLDDVRFLAKPFEVRDRRRGQETALRMAAGGSPAPAPQKAGLEDTGKRATGLPLACHA